MSPEDHARTLARGRRMGVAQIVALRFTPKQIRSEPAEVIDEIRRTLEGARARPPLNLRTVPASEVGQLVPASKADPLVPASKADPLVPASKADPLVPAS
jgi:hypothetical protein